MKVFSNISSKNIIVAMVAFCVISIGVGVFLYLNNPKIKFMRAINNEYKSLTTIFEQIKNSELASISEGETVVSSGNVSFDLMLSDELFGGFLDPFVDIVNDLSIDYEYGSDPNNDNNYVKFQTFMNQDSFIDVAMYQMRNKKYIYLNDIYDKYIESESIEVVKSQNNQIEDATYLLEKIKVSLISSLKTSDFKSEYKQIDVNNQIIDADKLALILTDKRMKEISRSILIDLKEDEKCIDILNSLNNDEEDFRVTIDEAIKSLDEEQVLTETLVFDMYINNNEIIKVEVYNGSLKTVEYLSYFTFYPVKKITLFNEKEIALTLLVEQKEDNHTAYELSFDEQKTVIKGSITKSIKPLIDEKRWNYDIAIDLLVANQNDLWGTMKINVQTTTKVGEKIEMIDINNIVKEEDLTEEETDEIINKLLEKLFNALPTVSDVEEAQVL